MAPLPASGALLAALAAAACAAPAPPPAASALPAASGPQAQVALSALPEGPLTLADALRLALERNPDLAVARARVAAARASLDAARSGFLPRISLEGSWVRADAPSSYLFRKIDARDLAPGTDFNDPGTFDDLQAGVALRWNLWDGGRTGLAAEAADRSREAAGEEARAVRNALAAAVAETFLDALAAAEVLAADDAAVRTVEAEVGETRVRVEGGAALRSDLLSLEVRLAEARQARLRTDLARRLALAGLRRLLALPPGGPIEPSTAPRTGAGALPADLAAALEEARRRPEAAAARHAVERARLEAEAARRARLPRVDAEARRWAGDGDATGDFGRRNWSVGVSLTVDLFDGGARAAGVHRADAALREAEAAERARLDGIDLEVEAAWLRLEEARARHGVTRQAVAAAEESFDLVRSQFEGGAATVTRYLEAEGARTRSRTTEVGARLDEERATVELERALGRLAPGASP